MSYKDIAKLPDPMEEIYHAPALWMWDYLRRSGARGFFLPLSGGADSAAVASLVASMSKIVFEGCKDPETLNELRRVVQIPNFTPTKYQDIVGQLLVTSYLSTKNSSQDTNSRAKRLAEGIGAHHFNVGIDEVYDSIVKTFERTTGNTPRFESQGGSAGEDLALQNI